ncbi:MAG: hypothetical protein DHS80DRAFT_24489 [Piptocephalis tieghemiana]|nr:MAG: hypothetical protein DHS80DRAFT_24489 [Piptocephalis tieghemiana]
MTIASDKPTAGQTMCMAELSILVVGKDVPQSPFVDLCTSILRKAGLQPQIHGMGTNVEGNPSSILSAVQECHREVNRAAKSHMVHLMLQMNSTQPESSTESETTASTSCTMDPSSDHPRVHVEEGGGNGQEKCMSKEEVE